MSNCFSVVAEEVDTTVGGHRHLCHIIIREAEAVATPDQDHAPTLETVSIHNYVSIVAPS